jgi:hypothetical protein
MVRYMNLFLYPKYFYSSSCNTTITFLVIALRTSNLIFSHQPDPPVSFYFQSYSCSLTISIILTFVCQSPPSFQAKSRVWDKKKETPALPISFLLSSYSCSLTISIILTFVYQAPPSFQAKSRMWDKKKETPALPVPSYFHLIPVLLLSV